MGGIAGDRGIRGAAQGRRKPPPPCLSPGCYWAAMSRGICTNCYRTLGRQVKAGKTTWAALEAAGLVLPSKR